MNRTRLLSSFALVLILAACAGEAGRVVEAPEERFIVDDVGGNGFPQDAGASSVDQQTLDEIEARRATPEQQEAARHQQFDKPGDAELEASLADVNARARAEAMANPKRRVYDILPGDDELSADPDVENAKLREMGLKQKGRPVRKDNLP